MANLFKMKRLSDHLHLRQADLLARNLRGCLDPWLKLRLQVEGVLKLRGLRLVKASKRVRPYLGEFYLLDLREKAVQRTNVDLLGLSEELGLDSYGLGVTSDPGVNCVVSTEVLG